jgi:uncharacterized protein DUF4261
MNLAFVLLSKASAPRPDDIVHAFTGFAADGQRLRHRPEPAAEAKAPGVDVLEFDAGEWGTGFVAAMPVPVPNREADDGAQFSVSSMGTGWQLPPHQAHLLVTWSGDESSPVVDNLSCYTSFLAAVTKVAGGVGVYWGTAGATHDPDFFLSLAEDPSPGARLMLWTGVSIAREPDGRLSLLSLGMQKQLELPDLLLVAPKSMRGGEALGTFFDLLAYLADRGEPLPEGDTVGRTAEEKLPVRYVPSPVSPDKSVWRVEIE